MFFDRDGTLIPDAHFRRDTRGLRLLSGAAEALRLLARRGVLCFVVTNQSGVARGYFSESAVRAVHRALDRAIRRAGGRVCRWFYCPHFPEGAVARYRRSCSCRKPAPGMVRRALAAYPVDPKRSFVVGDRPEDLGLAERAGLKGAVLVRTGAGRKSLARLSRRARRAAVVKRDVLSAVRWILREGLP